MVKIFEEDDSYELEKEINNFGKDVHIKNISASRTEVGDSTYYTAAVLYEN